jgi:PAS domain S-box-containing protein
MINKGFFQAVLIVGSAMLMANLGAMIDFYMHPEIPYFDEEHLVVGGVAGLVTAVLLGALFLYVRRLEKTTEDLSDANAMFTLEIMERKKTEEALREKEGLLSESQRLGHVGSFFIDETGLMQWSEELYHIFGVSPDTFTPNMESFLSQLHPEDRQAIKVWADSCMAGKQPDALEFRIIFPDGTIHFIRGDGEAVFDDKNRFLYLAGSGQDITERKKAEEKIRKQQELTTKIIETIPLRVFWKDRDLRFLGSNTLFATHAGVSRPEELIGKTDFEMAWKDQAEMYRSDDQQVMDANRPKLSYDEPQTSPEGVQIWLRTSKVPLHDDMNETIGILGVYEDITDYKQAAQALEESELRFRTILDAAVDGILVADAQSHDILVGNNAICKMLGYSTEELTGLGFKDIHPTEALPEVQRQFERQMRGESKVAPDLPVQRKDGSVFFADVSASPMVLGGRQLLVGVFHDVTERKLAEEALQRYSVELEKSNKELQEALANIKQLSGMLPICAACKKIRDDKGYWSEVELYISEHTETVFSHGICPDCEKKAYEDLEDLTNENF